MESEAEDQIADATTTVIPADAVSGMNLTGTLDPAVFYGLVTRIWTIAAGPVNLLLIGHFFAPAVQGFYYTFGSLVGWTAFLELGLATVVQQFVSHEWANLSLTPTGELTGDPHAAARLASLARIAVRWYTAVAIVSCITFGVGGAIFLARRAEPGVSWLLPWICLVLTAGGALALLPGWTILDGCNQLFRTNRARALIVVGGSIALWVTIVRGGGLWASTSSMTVNLVITVVFFILSYRRFFSSLRRTPTEDVTVNWQHELWPMQWRIALSWLSNYFLFSLITPVLFSVQGAAAAGQMGMTMTLANSVVALSLTWTLRRAPLFGVLVAKKQYSKLDQLFRNTLWLTIAVAAAGCTVVIGTLTVLHAMHFKLASRFLDPATASLMLFATVIIAAVSVMAAYLRAHKREPFLVPSLLMGVSIVGGAILCGRKFGVPGIAAAYLSSVAIFAVVQTAIFLRCRRLWHADE